MASHHSGTPCVSTAKRADARVLWLTGLSGSGKTTLAFAVWRVCRAQGRPACVLDGDDLRRGLSSDLGFEARDRSEHARRAVEVAHVLAGDGITAIVALISPGREDRARARARCGAELFVEVFVDAPLAVCERRDPKGLYAKARRGDLSGFTGIGSSYEPPARPDVWLKTDQMTVEACVAAVVHHAWANHTV